MVNICRTPIEHPSAWRSSDFASPDDYAIDLAPRYVEAFERALERIRDRGLTLDDIERRHFEVPEIAGDIAGWFDEIQHGRGFVFLRGFPVGRWSEDEVGIVFWGIGTHMGIGVSQSVLGDRLGHMMDFSHEDPNARAYRNRQELDLHTDLSEIVATLSLSKAKTGGGEPLLLPRHRAQRDPDQPSGISRAPLPGFPLLPGGRGGARRGSGDALERAGLQLHRGLLERPLRARLPRTGRRGAGGAR